MSNSLPPESGAVKTAHPTIENPTDRLQPETLEEFLERSVAHDPDASVEDAKAVWYACFSYRRGRIVLATSYLWMLAEIPISKPVDLLHERALAAWLLHGLLEAEAGFLEAKYRPTPLHPEPKIQDSKSNCKNWWCDFPAGKVSP